MAALKKNSFTGKVLGWASGGWCPHCYAAAHVHWDSGGEKRFSKAFLYRMEGIFPFLDILCLLYLWGMKIFAFSLSKTCQDLLWKTAFKGLLIEESVYQENPSENLQIQKENMRPWIPLTQRMSFMKLQGAWIHSLPFMSVLVLLCSTDCQQAHLATKMGFLEVHWHTFNQRDLQWPIWPCWGQTERHPKVHSSPTDSVTIVLWNVQINDKISGMAHLESDLMIWSETNSVPLCK